MKLVHRKIDFINDQDYILERHCRINYACDCPWKRKMPYDEYRNEWFSLTGQVTGFYDYLQETASDNRSIAEIIETENRDVVGYLWAPFHADEESKFYFIEMQDIYIEEEYRGSGIANELLLYVEAAAKANGAQVIRSGTGCENIASIKLHEKCGYYQYRYEFEKVL